MKMRINTGDHNLQKKFVLTTDDFIFLRECKTVNNATLLPKAKKHTVCLPNQFSLQNKTIIEQITTLMNKTK